MEIASAFGWRRCDACTHCTRDPLYGKIVDLLKIKTDKTWTSGEMSKQMEIESGMY